MRESWLEECLAISEAPADFYSGARKIRRGIQFSFPDLADDLRIQDGGYTRSKLSTLRRHYRHEESVTMAQALWLRRLEQGKYGSVGFTTYNHLVKNDPNKKSIRASVMGPCIQSIVLTLSDKGATSIDCFYRTTEIFKKFIADLVFIRDDLLQGFDLPNLEKVTFHFANVTAHPMYFVTIIPLLRNPIAKLDRLERKDKYFYKWVVKWTARYLCEEYSRGILKFSQALRVRDDAQRRIDPDLLPDLRQYLRDNHPGYTRDYTEADDDGDGE